MAINKGDCLDGRPFKKILKKYVTLNKDLLENMGILDTALESLEATTFYNNTAYSLYSFDRTEPFPFNVSASYDLLQDSTSLYFLNYKYVKKGFFRNKECVEELDAEKKKKIFDVFIHEIIHKDVYSVLGEEKDTEFLIGAKQRLIDASLEEVPSYFWNIYRNPDYLNVLLERDKGLSHIFTVLSMGIPFNEGEHLQNSFETSLPRVEKIWKEYQKNPSEQKFLEFYTREANNAKNVLIEYKNKESRGPDLNRQQDGF